MANLQKAAPAAGTALAVTKTLGTAQVRVAPRATFTTRLPAVCVNTTTTPPVPLRPIYGQLWPRR